MFLSLRDTFFLVGIFFDAILKIYCVIEKTLHLIIGKKNSMVITGWGLVP